MTYKKQFNQQKFNAKYRNIDWQFTYEEWIQWWGTDVENRGKSKGKLCMARIGDIGPYHPNNCYKSLFEENTYVAHYGKLKGPQSRELVERRAKLTRGVPLGPQTLLTCTHCNKIGGNNMKRYHFEFCKEKVT
jgi:hypothetical protein